MLKYHLPTIGVAVALCLFLVAGTFYPGGTTDSAGTVGYSLAHNFVCALFEARALNGDANPTRYVAMLAVLLLCVSVGFVYWRISRSVATCFHRSAIEIGGIGSAVSSLLVVTPMHD